ncbi:MAG: hypothetical protein LBF67_09270 [Prevotellaceae bacterium]|nr:hypothetical protein [Prevotellaceae bacterium]
MGYKLARAMLKNAPIIVLDEATAFADLESEQLIYEAFAALSKGKTTLMIAIVFATKLHGKTPFFQAHTDEENFFTEERYAI